MPGVTLDTPTGTLVFNYVISTPTHTSAPSIDPALPTVLFLHPVYLGKIIYHLQFADRELRRFNLIALDLRCHGQTLGKAGKGYGPKVAAGDVALFMSTLQIPRYHLFGMGMGGCIALQTAILFPASVLSIFVVSPPPLTEPPDVGAGLQEIYDCWAEEVLQGENIAIVEAGPTTSMSNSFTGTLQLLVNGCPTRVFQGIVQVSRPFAISQWSVDRLDDFHAVCVDFFIRREAFTVEAMRNIKCPVHIVHCGADVAYDLATTNQVADHLRTAGVSVQVVQIRDAPHLGIITHPKEVNALFHEFMLSVCAIEPAIPDQVESPWKAQLIAVGYDSDSDDELLITAPR
ncbi:Alpha/Beta hydrolase protein [Mycena vitilis]|nr:Alpha/Beta hydrolase protein [Mycena vitilis]